MGRTYIVTGFYGSGKTEFCVNLAMSLQVPVTIADLDVINPYFRSREKATLLARHKIDIMGNSLGNNTGQDLPAVSYAFTSRIIRGENVILDLAGGEIGVNLLAPCYNALAHCPAPIEFLCVLNLFRPETNTVAKMVDFIRGINAVSKLHITGLVNNGHMLHDTTAEHILSSQKVVCEAAHVLEVPVRYTLIRRDIYDDIADNIKSYKVLTFERLTMREDWQ